MTLALHWMKPHWSLSCMNNQPAWVLSKHCELDMIGKIASAFWKSPRCLSLRSVKMPSLKKFLKREFALKSKSRSSSSSSRISSPIFHRHPAQMPASALHTLHAPAAIRAARDCARHRVLAQAACCGRCVRPGVLPTKQKQLKRA